ncbi:ABC transporter permease [Rubellimicrobium arenae]|uniref:ABC transporter permease n=1 Tax=Rubellimicrobium arenae TaxID=2817372 RepID=UPI001B309D30|nr:ABC transporter permease [Rubellimicrobium arenae]
MRPDLMRFAGRHRWIWAALGVVILWTVLSGLTQSISLHALTGVATSAAFLLIAALGQMVVVTTGRGNIDLSIPSVITLSAFATVTVSGGQDANVPLAVAAVTAVALLTGGLNAILVVLLRIPAIIATLATGYMLATVTLLVNRQVKSSGTAETLAWLATNRVGGVPVVALLALAATVVAAWVLARLAYGWQLSATGQNWGAARLAGVPVGRTTALAFLASAMLAGITGMLLSAYAGGAFLEMGTPYLLQTVGAVVLGGTLIAGGSAVPAGTLFGALLLVLIVATMQIAGLPLGAQDIVQGVVIILVLALAGPRNAR